MKSKQLIKKLFPLHIETSQLDSFLYSVPYFQARLSVEKRRHERLGTQSALALLTIPIHLPEKERHVLLDVIFHALRESDVVCQFKKTVFFLLLPDTGIKGAEVVIERVLQSVRVYQDKSPLLDDLVVDRIKWEITLYPNDNIDSSFDLNNDSSKNWQTDEKKQVNFNQRRVAGILKSISRRRHRSRKNVFVDALAFIKQSLMPQHESKLSYWIKRGLDVILVMGALVFFAPLLTAISILIKLTSRGHVIYKQNRVGYTGKTFTLYKFRTMYTDASDEEHKKYMEQYIKNNSSTINNGTQEKPVFKLNNDPRITPVGRILRKLSLDELPQLLNVLKGDMSIVGPRPPIPYEVTHYETWHQRRFLEAKPGITGLWQVSGRNSVEFDEMVRLDIQYASKWSLLMDFKILLKTVSSLSTGR